MCRRFAGGADGREFTIYDLQFMIDDLKTKSEKKRWPAATGLAVGNALLERLTPLCQPECCCIAGSLRRKKASVGDVEILYVPKTGLMQKSGEMFESETSLPDDAINKLVRGGKLARRLNVDGHVVWGNLNKLAVHVATGLPVDFFATTWDNWFVSLVIRTGPKDFNIALIESAKKHELQLHAYGTFSRIGTGERIFPRSEREVFELAGMPWLEPERRN